MRKFIRRTHATIVCAPKGLTIKHRLLRILIVKNMIATRRYTNPIKSALDALPSIEIHHLVVQSILNAVRCVNFETNIISFIVKKIHIIINFDLQ